MEYSDGDRVRILTSQNNYRLFGCEMDGLPIWEERIPAGSTGTIMGEPLNGFIRVVLDEDPTGLEFPPAIRFEDLEHVGE